MSSNSNQSPDTVLFACSSCTGPVQSVRQYCMALPTRPGEGYVPYAMWFPLDNPGGCEVCASKPAFLDVTPEDLLVDGLVVADITVRAVRRAMFESEVARVEEARKMVPKSFPDPVVLHTMDAADSIVADRYSNVKGEDANKLLVLKLRIIMRNVDAMLDQVPMQAKVVFKCVDGPAVYTMSLLSTPVVHRPELIDERGHVRVHR